VTSDNEQPRPEFEVPENPLLKLPTETPQHRTRPVRRVRPRPEALGEIMPGTAIEMRRRQLDRDAEALATALADMAKAHERAQRAAVAEDIERTEVDQ